MKPRYLQQELARVRWSTSRHPPGPPDVRAERSPTAGALHSPSGAVLLVHGLWRSPLSFLPLVRRLREWGYRPEQFGYAAVAQPYDAIVARLARRLDQLGGGGVAYSVIGHSLGGVLLRSALARTGGPPPARLIMLATPNRPSRLARRLGGHWAYRRLMGECGLNLISPDFYAALPVPRVPRTIIAGTAGPRGRWSPFGDEPNDGIVAVDETRLSDDDQVMLRPVTHTFMMNDAGVQQVIRQTLTQVTGAL
jgi:alpha-beta hydrolase superfamily lysophospholipase